MTTNVGGSPPVVALVCSAGGLDALTRVLVPLLLDLPAAVLVLQHQRPNRETLITSDGPPPYRPSADLLLCSLAITAGPRVIAADRASSTHSAMPEAAIGRVDAVDPVLPVDDMAAALVACLAPMTRPCDRPARTVHGDRKGSTLR